MRHEAVGHIASSRRRTSHSLLYTSRKIIPPERDAVEIANILSVSRAYNAATGITGGLINTHRAFAQLLEGPAVAVDALMQQILADARHETITILRRVPITRRKLPFWTMAYSGQFLFVDARVEPLVGVAGDVAEHRIDELETMMVQFALHNS